MLSFDEFANEVKNNISDHMLLHEIEEIKTIKVTKNNGVIYNGLAISIKDGHTVPLINLDRYYMERMNGKEMDDILNEIAGYYEENLRVNPDGNMIKKYQPEALFVRMSNYERNRERLKDFVYEKYLDFALEVRMLVKADREEIGTAGVNNRMLAMWEVSREEVIKAAKENTPRIFPHELCKLEEKLGEMVPGEFFPETGLYILSNTNGNNGAAALTYPGVLDGFKKDMFILPSSVHEVLLIAADGKGNTDDLKEMVKSVNATAVPSEDYLSDNVYKYDAKTKEISIVGEREAQNRDLSDPELER